MKHTDLTLPDDVIVDKIDELDPEEIPDPVYSCREEYIDETVSPLLRKVLDLLDPASEEYEFLYDWHVRSLNELAVALRTVLDEEKIEIFEIDATFREHGIREYNKKVAEKHADRNKEIRKYDKECRAKDVPPKDIYSEVNKRYGVSRATYNRIREK